MLEMKVEPVLQGMIKDRIEESIATKQSLLGQIPVCSQIAQRLIEAYQDGRKVLFFGNGGSAADAQHIAAEFLGKYYMDRPALPAIALTANASVLTAIGNDYGFDQIFARQIDAMANPGDVAIAISTSGNSPNVIEGVRAGRRKGVLTVGLTGADGGLLRSSTDYCVCVPSADTPRIQEGHVLVAHIWAELVEQALFGGHD